MGENTVNFAVVADMLDRISKQKKHNLKRKTFRTFLDTFYKDREYFSVMRLILPELDRERGNYGLKESVLAKCLADALGLAKGSKDAESLINWRKGGSEVGKNAGNFGMHAASILEKRQSSISGELKVKQVNDMLDNLVAAKTRDEKSKILAGLINKTNALEMKWIMLIILKELKLGISEKTFFKEFHPDAEDVYNKTCDLKYVCEKLVDPKVRFKRQDIEVGKPVRPQLASRTANVESAWKKLKGKRVIAECKFDGDRCQIHKDGSKINFFSRSSIDHKEFADAMAAVILQNVAAEKCILDGEMVVWNRVTNRFMEFGKIQETAKMASEGIDTDEQLCYIVFDVLYLKDASVIHLPLHERQKLVAANVRPVSGRLEILQPDRQNIGQLWSISAQTPEQIEQFFKTTVENKDEGIVIKDLDSKWEPGDRSGKWIKLKPDYVHPESDLDVLIIGGYFGSGRKGGEVAQFLLGLAEAPVAGNPTKFVSFCKVGTGLSDEECATLVAKLKPYFKRYDKNARPPSCYIVTNNSKERPDVWIYPPDKSVVMQIASDIRCIKSEVFASPYCLRFPRVHQVRYDKPWYDCLTVQGLIDIVGAQDGAVVDVTKAKTKRTPKKKVVKSLLPENLLQTDVSGVKKASEILGGTEFYVANDAADCKTERIHKVVSENGGKFSMNLTGSVTHVLAANKKGLRYSTAAKMRDVLHFSWLFDSISESKLLPLRPKYVLHLTAETVERMKATMDPFGDQYFVDVDKQDLEQLFGNMQIDKLSVDPDDVEHFRRKFGGNRLFEGCSVYFHRPAQSILDGTSVVADVTLRRLALDVQVYGGSVETTVSSGTTHVVLYWEEGSLPLTSGLSLEPERLTILSVVGHQWLEDALEDGRLPMKDEYDLGDVFRGGVAVPEAVAGRRFPRKAKLEDMQPRVSLEAPMDLWKRPIGAPSELWRPKLKSEVPAPSQLWKPSNDGVKAEVSAPSQLWKPKTVGSDVPAPSQIWKSKSDSQAPAPSEVWKPKDGGANSEMSAPSQLWKPKNNGGNSEAAQLWKNGVGSEVPAPTQLWKNGVGGSEVPAPTQLWKSGVGSEVPAPAQLWKPKGNGVGSEVSAAASAAPVNLWRCSDDTAKTNEPALKHVTAAAEPSKLWKCSTSSGNGTGSSVPTSLWKQPKGAGVEDSSAAAMDEDPPATQPSDISSQLPPSSSAAPMDNTVDDFLMDMFPAFRAARQAPETSTTVPTPAPVAPTPTPTPSSPTPASVVPPSSSSSAAAVGDVSSSAKKKSSLLSPSTATLSSMGGACAPAKKKSKVSYRSLINDFL